MAMATFRITQRGNRSLVENSPQGLLHSLLSQVRGENIRPTWDETPGHQHLTAYSRGIMLCIIMLLVLVNEQL
jgi:hypothetical protein